ncbi:hypothetical protein [Methylobacterium sp. Gmos1]
MCAVLAGLALAGAVAAPAAAAEDFTGFYAGVNAGYGWGKERHAPARGGARPGTPLPAWSGPQGADGLPPSAARAADRNPALSSGARGGTR